MLEFHRENHADMTVAVRGYSFQIPYGIIECDYTRVVRLTEKPRLNFMINAGIYLIEPVARNYIKRGLKMEMTDLIQRLISEGQTVISFPIVEYWLDIGQLDNYERAQRDIQDGSCKI
jgi:NDP-sugar pyrophosphorylase family protein